MLLARGGGELDAALTLRQSGVRARDALYARIVDVADEVPGAATLDELVFYAADAKAPPHAGKRGKAEREAETGFAGRCSVAARRRRRARRRSRVGKQARNMN